MDTFLIVIFPRKYKPTRKFFSKKSIILFFLSFSTTMFQLIGLILDLILSSHRRDILLVAIQSRYLLWMYFYRRTIILTDVHSYFLPLILILKRKLIYAGVQPILTVVLTLQNPFFKVQNCSCKKVWDDCWRTYVLSK